MWGGPYDPNDEIQSRFGGIVEFDTMWELIEELWRDVGDKWAPTDLRLCRYFGLSDGWWLRGQASYDTALARESMQEELALIPRCSLLAASMP